MPRLYILNLTLLYLLPICLLIDASIALTYERRGTAVLPCNAPTQTIVSIAWTFEHPTSTEIIDTIKWVDGNFYYFPPWGSERTELDTKNGDLEISNLTLADDGTYTCFYGDGGGGGIPHIEGASHEVTITVPPFPTLTVPDWVDADAETHIICAVEAKPRVDLYFDVNGTTFEPEPSVGTGQGGTVITTISLDHQFGRQPARQLVTCVATTLNEPTDVLNSTSKEVDVFYKPSTSVQPLFYLDPIEGTSFTLACLTDDGRPDPHQYLWWKDGIPVEESSGFTLSLGTLNRTLHDGDYTCAGNNTAGLGETSQPYEFKVYYLDSVVMTAFTHDPVVEGYSTSANCSVEDAYPTNITSSSWSRDGTIVEDDGDRVTVEGESLTINQTEKEDGGVYTCTITTAAGTLSSDPNNLTVYYSPRGLPTLRIDTNPAAADENVTMTCGEENIDAMPANYTYTFMKEENNVTVNSTNSTWSLSPAGSVTVSGAYSCVIANMVAEGQPSLSQQLTVQGPPFIESSSEEDVDTVYGDEEAALFITCTASGHQRTLTWMKDDEELPTGLFSITEDILMDDYQYDQTEALQQNLTWIPPPASCDQIQRHAGLYRCDASAQIRGQKRVESSHTITVDVKYAPMLRREQNITIAASVGNLNVTMPCDVCANPAPLNYTWSKNDLNVDHGTEESLVFANVTEADYGIYMCTVTNVIGSTFVVVGFVEAALPGKPDGFAAIAESSRSLTVSWIPGFNGGLPQTFKLEGKREDDTNYTTIQTVGIEDSNPPPGEEWSISLLVNEIGGATLEASTRYTFRVRGENGHVYRYGEYTYAEGRTKDLPVVELVADTFSFTHETSLLYFEWVVIAGDPDRLDLQYRESSVSHNTLTFTDWTVMVSVDPARGFYQSIVSAQLDPSKAYLFRLVAYEGEYASIPPDDDDGSSITINPRKDGLSLGVIIGIAVGGGAIVVLVLSLTVYVIRRGRPDNTCKDAETKRVNNIEGAPIATISRTIDEENVANGEGDMCAYAFVNNAYESTTPGSNMGNTSKPSEPKVTTGSQGTSKSTPTALNGTPIAPDAAIYAPNSTVNASKVPDVPEMGSADPASFHGATLSHNGIVANAQKSSSLSSSSDSTSPGNEGIIITQL